ncbi:MAG: N-acetylmuramoyl-L-alanine amidase-like domain-containing protein [Pirellulales bacterium]
MRTVLLAGFVLLAVLCVSASAESPDIQALESKPLYEFTEAEVGAYIHHLQATEPNLRKRIVHLARKNLGQPYDIYLLGEMPFETYDPQPIYCLSKSDCVVFGEHTYAMALTGDWPAFMKMLQRIRYRDGQIGVATRNHYTEADWVKSNQWLVRDVTAKVAGGENSENCSVTFDERIDRAKFLKGRYGLTVDIPVELHHDQYLPYTEVDRAAPHLEDGDFVNICRGVVKPGNTPADAVPGSVFVGHVGFVAHGPDGTLHMIHSTTPAVREEPLAQYIARSTASAAELDAAGKPRLVGFKFLRLENDPLANLRKLDGPAAPRVSLPLEDASQFWHERLQ